MDRAGYQRLYEVETTPEALEASCAYLAGKMQPFLSIQEPVLICYPDRGPKSLGHIFKCAVERCGATAINWDGDFRWKELLRLAFETHANTLIAHPLITLGLLKMAAATSTPLYIYDLIFGGYPYSKWMIEGVKRGLDCRVWGCYAAYCGPVIIAFTCNQESGLHLRSDIFDLEFFDYDPDALQRPHKGGVRFIHKKDPSVIFEPNISGYVHYQPCSCGEDAPRMVELRGNAQIPALEHLEQDLLSWASVLDYRARVDENGLDLEIVVFPGEQLPMLPNCAKLLVRAWKPDTDIPFFMQDNFVKIPEKSP